MSIENVNIHAFSHTSNCQFILENVSDANFGLIAEITFINMSSINMDK